MKISRRKQQAIAADAGLVVSIYTKAVSTFGYDAVHKDLTRIWDMRCMLGIQKVIPFGSMQSTNMSELLWVAENVCGIKRTR